MPNALQPGARPLVIGNWKMHGALGDLPIIGEIEIAARQAPDVEVGLAIPAPLLIPAWQAAATVRIGAQAVHGADQGAHTGCVSASMVKDAGAVFTIAGHSERRAQQHESDEDVASQILAAHRQGLSVILCVGENLQARRRGQAARVVEQQVRACLPAIGDGAWLSLAYEPIWAIGSGRSASLEDIADMHGVLRAACHEILGSRGDAVRLLYGGSVNANNAEAILALDDVDGVLVGGASLTAAGFSPIIVAASALRHRSQERAQASA